MREDFVNLVKTCKKCQIMPMSTIFQCPSITFLARQYLLLNRESIVWVLFLKHLPKKSYSSCYWSFHTFGWSESIGKYHCKESQGFFYEDIFCCFHIPKILILDNSKQLIPKNSETFTKIWVLNKDLHIRVILKQMVPLKSQIELFQGLKKWLEKLHKCSLVLSNYSQNSYSGNRLH